MMISNYFKQIEKMIIPKTHSLKEIQKSKSKTNTNSFSHCSMINNIFDTNTQNNSRTKLFEKEIIEKKPLPKNIPMSTKENLGSRNQKSLWNISAFSSPRKNIKLIELNNKIVSSLKKDESRNITADYETNYIKELDQNEERPDLSYIKLRNCKDIDWLKDIINEEKKKNMNYRHGLYDLNKKNEEFKKLLVEKNKEINNLKKEKELDNNYILKMEKMLNQLTKNTFSGKQNHKDYNFNNNIIRKENEVDKGIIKILTDEVNKLRDFKNGVYNISLTYDEINMNIINTLKEIEKSLSLIYDCFKERSHSHIHMEFNKILGATKTNFENLIFNFEKSLNAKQEEFNFLLNEKDREYLKVQDELIKYKHYLGLLHEDKIIGENKITENELLPRQERINELKNQNLDTVQRNANKTKSLIKKELEPANNSVKRSIRKLKNCLDLKDVSNVKLLERIKLKVNY